MSKNDEMKLCPFCGNTQPGIGVISGTDVSLGKQRIAVAYVECLCGARGPTVMRDNATGVKAAEAWNKRVPASITTELLEALSDLCAAWDNSGVHSERVDKYKGNITKAHHAAMAAIAKASVNT